MLSSGHSMNNLLLLASPQTLFTYEVKNDKMVWGYIPQPFKENLLNVDEITPAVLAEMLLLVHHHVCTYKTDELCEGLTAADPLCIGSRYRLKIQRFLEALSLDMTPHKAWDGNITIPPLFHIGEHAFHPYERAQLRNYLFHHTTIEHPSTSRYACGELHLLEDGRIEFNLPLQIRYSYAEG